MKDLWRTSPILYDSKSMRITFNTSIRFIRDLKCQIWTSLCLINRNKPYAQINQSLCIYKEGRSNVNIFYFKALIIGFFLECHLHIHNFDLQLSKKKLCRITCLINLLGLQSPQLFTAKCSNYKINKSTIAFRRNLVWFCFSPAFFLLMTVKAVFKSSKSKFQTVRCMRQAG